MRINLKDAFILDRYEKELEFRLPVENDEDLNTLASFSEEPVVRFYIRGKYGSYRGGEKSVFGAAK